MRTAKYSSKSVVFKYATSRDSQPQIFVEFIFEPTRDCFPVGVCNNFFGSILELLKSIPALDFSNFIEQPLEYKHTIDITIEYNNAVLDLAHEHSATTAEQFLMKKYIKYIYVVLEQ